MVVELDSKMLELNRGS